MCAPSTCSRSAGQSSRVNGPAAVMSTWTPGARSWSTARMTVTSTPTCCMIAIDRSISVWVCDRCGDGFNVPLMYTARRSS